jgi:hypothetical protein
MCCSTGVCGPSVDKALVRFAADLDWIKQRGVAVDRYNLSQQPRAFVENAVVKGALHEGGSEVLPLVLVDGRVVSKGAYPSRQELAAWLGIGDEA